MRKFEKVSLEQFKKDYYKLMMGEGIETCAEIDEAIKDVYEGIKLPRRATQKSSGYDFASTAEFVLRPNDSIIVPTGIKASMEDFEELMLFVRSSVGIKYNVILSNCTGKIDADYYNNPDNEGHIMLAFTNYGEKDWGIGIGDRVAQGTFYRFEVTDDDNPTSETRDGGIGSTGRKHV